MTKTFLMASAAAALCIGGTQAAAQQITQKDRPEPRELPAIMVILAHPDDEITLAPILARAASDGAKVTLVFATSGNAGPGSSGLEPGEQLAKLREDEARCASFAMGLSEPTFWRLDDGKLGETPRAEGSRARQAIAKIDEVIAQEKPRVVMTWGPDGGYGHADHRMVSSLVTQVVQGMEDDRPDLLYWALPSGSRPELPEFEAWATTDPDLVTDRLRYRDVDLEAARAAIGCYASQFSDEVREALPGLLHSQIWRGAVHFRLAFATPR